MTFLSLDGRHHSALKWANTALFHILTTYVRTNSNSFPGRFLKTFNALDFFFREWEYLSSSFVCRLIEQSEKNRNIHANKQ
jgi:hypothetical protein